MIHSIKINSSKLIATEMKGSITFHLLLANRRIDLLVALDHKLKRIVSLVVETDIKDMTILHLSQ
jgi:hypothetical protein